MASTQDHGLGASSPTAHKPTIMEQVKEKVSVVKDKLTGHEHHAPGAAPSTLDTHTTPATTTAHSPKSPKQGESMMQKIKDKLPGSHADASTKTTTPTPVHTGTTHQVTGDLPHQLSTGEKIANIFKPGHSVEKTHPKEAHGVTKEDNLKM